MLHAFTDIPSGWAEVMSAALDTAPLVITSAIGVGAAVLGPRWSRRLKRIQEASETSAWHNANAHVDANGNPINMRDDQDQKHAETMGAIQALSSRVHSIEKDVGGIRQELRTLHENDAIQHRDHGRLRDQMDDLERTIPKPPPS